MIKRLLGYLLLIAVALPASAAFDIGQLMGDLARHKGGKAKFVEKKYFAILDILKQPAIINPKIQNIIFL